jgi:hypothetical protein
MVTFNFKLIERGTVYFPLSNPERLDSVLQQCTAGEGINLGSYIAVRGSKAYVSDSLSGFVFKDGLPRDAMIL